MSTYIPPSIRTVRQDIQQTVVLSGGQVLPVFVGTANAQKKTKTATQLSLGASATFSIPSLLPAGPATDVYQLRTLPIGGLIYAPGADFSFNASLQQISFTSAALSPPYLVSGAVAATGGTVASGTFYYVITAIRTSDLTGPVVGETSISNQLTVVVPVGITTGSVALKWATVPGAEGYKIYRSATSGTYTGSTLLTTISGGYQNTFTDVGNATGTGTPPGAPVAGSDTSSNTGPFALTANQTLVCGINGAGNLTATFTATAANLIDSAAAFPLTFAGGEVLDVKVDGGVTQVVTFDSGSLAAADVAVVLNAQLTGCSATVVGGHVKIISDLKGSGSGVWVTGGTANTSILLNFSTTAAHGTGNVVNIGAVTATEVAGILSQAYNYTSPTGATATVTHAGNVLLQANTTGVLGSVKFDVSGTATATIGFDTSLHSGTAGNPATALRRPALNGGPTTAPDKFYLDYGYEARQDFVVQRFTNMGLGLSAFGLGSNLGIAVTLAMGLSGRGNGASAILCMSVPNDNLITYQTAFDFLGRRRDVDIVVPCVSDPAVNTALNAHCEFASSVDQKRERWGIVGPASGTAVGDVSTTGTAVYQAQSLTRRMMMVYPWPFVDVQQADLTVVNTELDGWASAVAVAGMIAALPDRAEPATTKQVFGITALGGDALDEQTMNILGAAGVTVLAEEDGQIIVRDSLLAETTSDVDRHPNILLVEDFLRKTLRVQFKSFRGRKLLGNLLSQIIKRTKRVLDQFVKLALIAGFDANSITAVQDPDALTNVLITFSYRPVFPVRLLTFNYSLDLSTAALAA